MSLPVLDQAVIAGLRRLSRPGEPDVAGEVLTLFVTDAPARLAAIAAAVSAGDAVALEAAAHALKGAAAAIGAIALRTSCAELETTARTGVMTDAPAQQQSVRVAYAALRAEIDHLL